MSAAPDLVSPPAPAGTAAHADAKSHALARLRDDLTRRFPGAVVVPPADARLDLGSPLTPRTAPMPVTPRTVSPAVRALLSAPFAWVESSLGEGGLAWLAAWTHLAIARDPLRRPALWVDTHGTLTAGDLIDLQGELVVVRPEDPNDAHVAADIALRAGSFSLVALEMHRALHPKPLARLARLAQGAQGAQGAHGRGGDGDARTKLVLWGEPPSFVAPPSGTPRTSFGEAAHALYEGLFELVSSSSPTDCIEPAVEGRHASSLSASPEDLQRIQRLERLERIERLQHLERPLHTTDRLRPMERAPDRRPSASGPSPSGSDVDERGDRPTALEVPYLFGARARSPT